jgi:hypothetical protein
VRAGTGEAAAVAPVDRRGDPGSGLDDEVDRTEREFAPQGA